MKLILDYFEIIVLIIQINKAPYARNFSCDMTHFNFPLVQEFVPFYAVLMFGIIGPIYLIILVEMFNAKLYPCTVKNENIRIRFKKV